MTRESGNPDILMVWPRRREVPAFRKPDGYSLHRSHPATDSWWVRIHRQAVPSFAEPDLRDWLERYHRLALPEGILVSTDDATGEPVATAGCIANSRDGTFPGGGQIAWVATVPEARGRGLATWLTALATRRLVNEGFERIFLCTGDDLIPAIGVYHRLGFVPCLYAPDQRERWARICSGIDAPFEPDAWPDPEMYCAGGEGTR